MIWFRWEIFAPFNAFGSKRSAYSSDNGQMTAREENMYFPFAEAMNYALELSSDIEVDGLPQFKNHIAFVPCNKGVQSDRIAPGSSFKPDLALMSLTDAWELHGFDPNEAPKLSELIEAVEKAPPPGSINWKTFLSAIEMKRMNAELPPLGVFDRPETQVSIIPEGGQRLDGKPDDPPPMTCKIDLIL